MAEIDLNNLTSKTPEDTSVGTGVFDVLSYVVEEHISDQYKQGRLAGTDYANVYLGSMQSVLSESVKFLLSEQQADKQADLINEQINTEQKRNSDGGIIDLERQKTQEEIDLIIAKTASEYERVDSSRESTKRDNSLNAKHLVKVEKDTDLVATQISEMVLTGPVERDLKVAQKDATVSGASDGTNMTNAKVALTNAQEAFQITQDTEFKLTAPAERILTTARTDLIGTQEAGQLRKNIWEEDVAVEKQNLIIAQTTGFKVDAKQKLLKQMSDIYSMETTTLGTVASPPNASSPTNIDKVVNDILGDLDVTPVVVS